MNDEQRALKALDDASRPEWASACADMLWTRLKSDRGGMVRFVQSGFDAFEPIARVTYRGHGFTDRDLKNIYQVVADRITTVLGDVPKPNGLIH